MILGCGFPQCLRHFSNSKFFIVKRFLLFVFATGFVTLLSAQVDLEIAVFNALDNTPIPNRTVLLSNKAIGYSMEKQTNAQGKIQFQGILLSDNYAVFIAETPEFFEIRRKDIALRSYSHATVSLPFYS